MRVIGFSGLMRSGKTTAANVLVEEADYTKFSFATPMMEALEALDPPVAAGWLGLTRLSALVERIGWEQAKTNREVRRLFQTMGDAGKAAFGEMIWIHTLFDRAFGCDLVVIDDVRFPNEARAIEDRGGMVVRIVRPHVTKEQARLRAACDHVSERAVDDDDFPIQMRNTGGLEQYRIEVKSSIHAWERLCR